MSWTVDWDGTGQTILSHGAELTISRCLTKIQFIKTLSHLVGASRVETKSNVCEFS